MTYLLEHESDCFLCEPGRGSYDYLTDDSDPDVPSVELVLCKSHWRKMARKVREEQEEITRRVQIQPPVSARITAAFSRLAGAFR